MDSAPEQAWAARMRDPAQALAWLDAGPPSPRSDVVRAYLHWRQGRYDEALAALERAGPDLGPLWSARSQSVRGGVLLNLGRAQAALEAYRTQLSLAQEIHDPEMEGLAHNDTGVLLVWDDPARAQLRYQMAFDTFLAAGSGHEANLGLAAFNLSVACAEQGQQERSDELLALATDLVRRAQAWPYWVGTISQAALRAAAAGQLAGARALLSPTDVPLDALPADSRATLTFFHAKVEALHGDPARALALLDDLEAADWPAQRADMLDDLLETRACALERAGDLRGACEALRALVTEVRARSAREREMELKVAEVELRAQETRRASEHFRAQAQQFQALHREASALSLTDELTGLSNRRHFMAWAEQNLNAGLPVALAFVDIDGFKGVNDRDGHACGDRVIQVLAGLLRQHARESDLVTRLGGDEFVVGRVTADLSALAATLELIRAACQAHPWADAGVSGPGLTLSVGVAAATLPLSEGLRRADLAMYAAKRAGRNRVQVSPPGSRP